MNVPSKRDQDLADEFHAPVVNSGDNLMAVIARAASDPNTDVDKLERLMAMYERIKGQSAKAEYFSAMSEMQAELPAIKERGEIKIGQNPGQKYALWEDINAVIKPVLKQHGFALSFRTGIAEGKITVTGVLSHRGGHSEETTMHLPTDTSGSKNAVQAVGSSTSYGKRYVASALLNLTTGDPDDDGNAGGNGGTITEDQAEVILGLLTNDGASVERFCEYMKVPSLLAIPAPQYSRAIEIINTRSQKAKEKKT